MNIDQQNIIAAADSLLRQSSAAAIYLPLADSKSLYMGSPADIASMLPDQIGAAVRGEAVEESWKPNIVLIANACEKYEEGSAVGVPEHGMAQAFQYLLSKMPVSARAADALDSQPTEADARDAARYRHVRILENHFRIASYNRWVTPEQFDLIVDKQIGYQQEASSQPTDGGVRND